MSKILYTDDELIGMSYRRISLVSFSKETYDRWLELNYTEQFGSTWNDLADMASRFDDDFILPKFDAKDLKVIE